MGVFFSLRIWRQTNKTIVFVTHNIQEAVFLSDRICVLSPHPGRLSAIVDVATENWDEAYAGLREGYSGGYQLAGSSWSQNVTSGNVYARLQDVLGIEYEGGQYVKYSGENLEYRLYDLHLDVENAPLAPSVPDGITQLNVTGTITVDVPLSFGFGHLPPMQITMKLNAKYVPRF